MSSDVIRELALHNKTIQFSVANFGNYNLLKKKLDIFVLGLPRFVLSQKCNLIFIVISNIHQIYNHIIY